MKWEGTFTVPGRPDEVIAQFADIERMASYLPGASIEGRDEDGSYIGAITVTFGPKKLVFRGKMRSEIDTAARTGVLQGQGASDQRAARFKVKVTYELDDAADATSPATRVKLTSDAELQGVLEDFARTGGPAVAAVILEEFAKRFAAGMATTAPRTSAAPQRTPPKPLSAPPLMLRAFWQMVKHAFGRR